MKLWHLLILILILFLIVPGTFAQDTDCNTSLARLRVSVDTLKSEIQNPDTDSVPDALFEAVNSDLQNVELYCSPEALTRDLTADELVSEGISTFLDGDYDATINALTQALQTPDDIQSANLEEIWTILGNAYNEIDDFENSIWAHENALTVNPDYYVAWVNIGITYRLMGDLDSAEASYLNALELQPDYAELHASLGALYVFRDEPESAITELELAIELDPQLAIAHSNLALAYAMVGRYDEADSSLTLATALGYANSATMRERIDAIKAQDPDAP